jgi:hypothetical protein
LPSLVWATWTSPVAAAVAVVLDAGAVVDVLVEVLVSAVAVFEPEELHADSASARAQATASRVPAGARDRTRVEVGGMRIS